MHEHARPAKIAAQNDRSLAQRHTLGMFEDVFRIDFHFDLYQPRQVVGA
jgi:hypothetical protein